MKELVLTYDMIREKVNSLVSSHNEKNDDEYILLKALQFLGEAFDRFIDDCIGVDGPKAPSNKSLAKARAYLPPHCKNAYKARMSR